MKKILFILFAVVVVPIAIYQWRYGGFAASPTDTEQMQQSEGAADGEPAPSTPPDPDRLVAGLIENEQLIRIVGRELATLNELVLNLDLTPNYPTKLFAADGRIREFKDITERNVAEKAVVAADVELGPVVKVGEQPKVWSQLFEQIDYFDNAKFYVVRVSDRSFLPELFTTKVGFEALARTHSGNWWAIQATGEIQWSRKGDRWEIASLDFKKFSLLQARQLLFEAANSRCFEPSDRIEVQRSAHFEKILQLLSEGPTAYDDDRQKRYFPHIATARHPSVAVVDIDQDGWDDLYVVEQWRKNMLFRNNRNGTFSEVAASYGLDVNGYGASALFADFDKRR